MTRGEGGWLLLPPAGLSPAILRQLAWRTSVTITPPSPDGYYTLRTPIEIEASATPGSAARFLTWSVSGDHRWSWWWHWMHGEASNPARVRVGPGLAYRAQFVDGPIFRVDSNVDPVPVTVDRRERRTPIAFRADRFSGTTTVAPRLIEFRGAGYRHRFRSWSDGGDMTHTVEVPQDTDSTLTLTLDTEYRLNTRAWGSRNSVDAVPSSSDGFYPEGAEVRLLAVARPPAAFIGWNGAVSGRDPTAMVVMDDGQLAEAAFARDSRELQSGVPAHVSLQWQGADLEYHELDFEKYYVKVPSDASELEVRFDTRSATPGAEAGLWVADQDLWPGWVKGHETADLILRDGAASVTIRRPRDRWPAAYTILVRAAESNTAQTQTLEGTLEARIRRHGNRLVGGQQLSSGQFLQAEAAACRLVFQTDGNLVAYKEGVAYWNARTGGVASGGSALMQPDGNFVVYDTVGVARWSTGTAGNRGAYLGIENDCNVVLHGAGGAALWASGRP